MEISLPSTHGPAVAPDMTSTSSTGFPWFGVYMGVEPKIGGKLPNHPLKNGFSIIDHPFWGTSIFGNTHMSLSMYMLNPHIHYPHLHDPYMFIDQTAEGLNSL